MPLKHILLAVLVAAVWGINFIFVKLGVHEVPPLFLCAVRFLLASIPAIFFVRFPTSSFKMIALYGLVMFALQFAFIFCGFGAGMTAGMASLILQTAVFFSIFFAAVFLNEIPTFWQVTGALISFAGIAVAATHLDSNMTLAGFLFILVGAALSGLGNYIARKLGRVDTFALIAWGCLVAFPPLLIMSLIVEGPEKILYSVYHMTWLAPVSLLYIVYISTWVGYGAWSWLLGRYPVSTVVPFSLLIPVFAMLSSTIFLGESFEPWKLTVTTLVIAGLCVFLLMPRLIARWKKMVLSVDASEA